MAGSHYSLKENDFDLEFILSYRGLVLTMTAFKFLSSLQNTLLNWFLLNPWKDDDEVMNIWKSYIVLRV